MVIRGKKLEIFKKFLSIITLFVFIVSIFSPYSNAVIYNTVDSPLPVATISDTFPSSYQPYIDKLKASHPNWIFKAINTGLDWTESVRQESYEVKYGISTVHQNYSVEWKKDGLNNYVDGPYVVASKTAVAYTLDPRNFLNDSGIFQFEALDFNEATSSDTAINKVISGTTMSSYPTQYKNAGNWITFDDVLTWSQIIKNASKNAGKTIDVNSKGVSAVFLISRMKQENSLDIVNNSCINGSYSGFEGIYNFYNIGATPNPDGSGSVTNGLTYAKSQGWTTPQIAIEAGATYLWKNYIRWGQNTVYFQKFDVNNIGNSKFLYGTQYMTNIMAPSSEAKITYNAYLNSGLLDSSFVFYIPVYNNMPSEVSRYPETEVTSNLTGTDIVYLDDGVANGTDYFNIRSGPGTDYNVIARVVESVEGAENRTKFTRVEVGTNGYDKIRLSDNTEGYVYQGYVKQYSYTHVTGIDIDKKELTLNQGETAKITPTITPSNAYLKNVIYSSSNPLIATVDSSGNIVAVGNDVNSNVAIITAKTLDSEKTATCNVTVNTYATAISTNAEYAIIVGDSLDLKPVYTPLSTTNKNYDTAIADPSIAQVVDGKIKGLAVGSTTVTFTTKDGSNKTCEFKLNVVEKVVSLINVKLDEINNIVTNVAPGTTTATIKSDIETSYLKKIYDSNNKELVDGDNVGTNSKIRIYNGDNLLKEFTIVVYGDVNGDGLVDSTDLLMLRQHMLNIRTLSNYYYLSGNIYRTDAVIDSTDLLLMRQHMLSIRTIEQ